MCCGWQNTSSHFPAFILDGSCGKAGEKLLTFKHILTSQSRNLPPSSLGIYLHVREALANQCLARHLVGKSALSPASPQRTNGACAEIKPEIEVSGSRDSGSWWIAELYAGRMAACVRKVCPRNVFFLKQFNYYNYPLIKDFSHDEYRTISISKWAVYQN